MRPTVQPWAAVIDPKNRHLNDPTASPIGPARRTGTISSLTTGCATGRPISWPRSPAAGGPGLTSPHQHQVAQLHAAKRPMVAHLEGRTDMKNPKRNYANSPEPITIIPKLGVSIAKHH